MNRSTDLDLRLTSRSAGIGARYLRSPAPSFSQFPKGWFFGARSIDVEPGVALPLRLFGRELMLYRGESGAVYALGAFCPHLGAHLGHGGKVWGDEVECPFHGWRFDGHGACVAVPSGTKIPPLARVDRFPTQESGDVILLYNNAGDRAEPFAPPLAPHNDGWTTPHRFSWSVHSYVQELVEGSVDPIHFQRVHGAVGTPTCVIRTDGVDLQSTIKVQFVGENPPGQLIDATLETSCRGLGFVVTRTDSGASQARSIAYLAPVDDREVRVEVDVQVKKLSSARATDAFESAFLTHFVEDFERDRVIWENKIYHERPSLADGDGPIMPFRRWARQFDEHSGTSSE